MPEWLNDLLTALNSLDSILGIPVIYLMAVHLWEKWKNRKEAKK